MKYKVKLSTFNIILTLLILVSMFFMLVKPANAWFSEEHLNVVEMEITTNRLNLNVYQDSKIINSNGTIKLEEKITPETDFEIDLTLQNDDVGTESMYVRFKMQMKVIDFVNNTTKTLDSFTIEGMDNDFVLDNGYYYYKPSGNLAVFASGTSKQLCTTANISLEDFQSCESGDIVRLYLTIEASIDTNF